MARVPILGDISGVLDEGLEGLEHNFVTARIEDLVKWSRARSCWPATFGLACCAIEMMAMANSRWDSARFGAEVFRASPRQADLMIVSGRISIKMMPVLLKIYEQMPEPKWVISMGACASSGGVFDTYTLVQGVDQFLPVHCYIPGCPPRPESLLDALMKIQAIIGEEDERDEKEEMETATQLEKPASAERETTEPPLPGGS
ncbi:MAG TPA: NADH-quinone oxidoreductase subunit B [Acidimicrobiaceae bacterium]|nr:NADH-quinone oxidoreductase subunit B [Acidimicrobiaceae bacterium]